MDSENIDIKLRQQINMNPSKYHIIRQIGEGQEGKIYLAKSQGELYAIKELNDHSNNPQFQLLSSIQHPGIITLYDTVAREKTSLVLQYASQGDLAAYIRRNFPQEHVPQQLIRSWLLQISLALYHLHHQLNIIHRDIKMINVLVLQNGQLKLSDFGLAKKIRGEDDFTKSTVGTPYYLSPETLNNNRCSSKSDMWALGCLLFEICTGEKPFKGTAFGEIIKNILEKTTEEIPSCYSKWISDLIKSLLDKNSEKRPSVQSILDDEEMQKQFISLKSTFKDYQKINYPQFNLKTAKNLVRECLGSNIKIFSESLKTAKKQKQIKIPIQQKPPSINEQKKVERTKFAHKSLKALLQRRVDSK